MSVTSFRQEPGELMVEREQSAQKVRDFY